MEIAHAQGKVLRVIAKLVLLGVLVVLLAKVILMLLVLAVVGFLTYVVARALYNRRFHFKQILLRTKDRLIHSAAAVSQTGPIAIAAACGASRMLLRLAEILKAFLVLAITLLGHAAKIGWMIAWKCVRTCQSVLAYAFVAFFYPLKRIAVASIRMAGAGLAKMRSRSRVIFGTLVEASSGALIGAMLAFIPSLQQHEPPIAARVGAAALFGAFLGITVSLSRTSWAKQEVQSPSLDSQN